MQKAVILARVSTKDQEEYGHSLPAQTQKLREYAQRKGFEVIKEFAFSESAGTKIRKKFEEVLGFLKAQKDMPALLCQNVDRVTTTVLKSTSNLSHYFLNPPEYESKVNET
jgi:site-specific DNA recombinase